MAVGAVRGASAGRISLLTSGRSIGPALARGVDPRRRDGRAVSAGSHGPEPRQGRARPSWPTHRRRLLRRPCGGRRQSISPPVWPSPCRWIGDPGIVAVCCSATGACGVRRAARDAEHRRPLGAAAGLVCDNNQLSISTPREPGAGAAPALRPRHAVRPPGARRLTGLMLTGRGCEARGRARPANARAGHGPGLLECVSERFYSHSTATRETRRGESESQCALAARSRAVDRLAAPGLCRPASGARRSRSTQPMVAGAIAFAKPRPIPIPA